MGSPWLDETSHHLSCVLSTFLEQNWSLLAGKKGNGFWSGASRRLHWAKGYRISAHLSQPAPLFTFQLALGTPRAGTSMHPASTSPVTPLGSSWPDSSWVLKQTRCNKSHYKGRNGWTGHCLAPWGKADALGHQGAIWTSVTTFTFHSKIWEYSPFLKKIPGVCKLLDFKEVDNINIQD